VELLVVIAIIGVLVALLLPAIQAAREAARRAQCKSNLKQIALAGLNHETTHKHFPTGGWGYSWGGDPDRGFGWRQPSGWYFNILPWTELASLRNMGSDGQPDVVTPQQKAGASARVKTYVDLFICPSRRGQTHFPWVTGVRFFNVDIPDVVARTDYAACSGTQYLITGVNEGPLLGSGGAMPDPMKFTKYNNYTVGRAVPLSGGGEIPKGDGVVLIMSETRIAQISDGTTSTILLGEKHIPQSDYDASQTAANNQGWDLGMDIDNNRWTKIPPMADTSSNTIGADELNRVLDGLSAFGSSHAGGAQFVFCDGSVKSISYDVDREMFRRLGSIDDGEVVNLEF